ncbi:uncharacterized protein LOC117640681 [Thrips palmi]|uniref:Uncharacterized protein LOC117640681 n=1 Tax=Thrips palmi TaxID=161013 RepID=A0A6P8YHD6_THRPL|nr:uncharacterized protein LOC117640681 [Thrips palmi]
MLTAPCLGQRAQWAQVLMLRFLKTLVLVTAVQAADLAEIGPAPKIGNSAGISCPPFSFPEETSANGSATFILGLSGSGKTTVSLLLTHPFHLLVEQDENHGTTTFHDDLNKTSNGVTSKTKFPEIFIMEEDGLVFVDFPGFSDNRGSCLQVEQAMAMNAHFRKTKRVKILLTAPFSSLEDRANDFLQLLLYTVKLIKNSPKYSKSIGFIFTKAQRTKKEFQMINFARHAIKNVRSYINRDFTTVPEQYRENMSKLLDNPKFAFFGHGVAEDESGRASEIPSLQKVRSNILHLLKYDLEFVETSLTDFGYSLTEFAAEEVKRQIQFSEMKITHLLHQSSDTLARKLNDHLIDYLRSTKRDSSFPTLSFREIEDCLVDLDTADSATVETLYCSQITSLEWWPSLWNELLHYSQMEDLLEGAWTSDSTKLLKPINDVAWFLSKLKCVIIASNKVWRLTNSNLLFERLVGLLESKEVSFRDRERYQKKLELELAAGLTKEEAAINLHGAVVGWEGELQMHVTSVIGVNAFMEQLYSIKRCQIQIESFLHRSEVPTMCSVGGIGRAGDWFLKLQHRAGMLIRIRQITSDLSKMIGEIFPREMPLVSEVRLEQFNISNLLLCGQAMQTILNELSSPGLWKQYPLKTNAFDACPLGKSWFSEIKSAMSVQMSVHQVTGYVLKISEISSLIPADQPNLEIIAIHSLIIDADLDTVSNLTIVAPTVVVVGIRSLKVNGLSGGKWEEPARQASVPGWRGENGKPGHPGRPGGRVILLSDTIINSEQLTIEAHGGNGGPGQQGGRGADGADESSNGALILIDDYSATEQVATIVGGVLTLGGSVIYDAFAATRSRAKRICIDEDSEEYHTTNGFVCYLDAEKLQRACSQIDLSEAYCSRRKVENDVRWKGDPGADGGDGGKGGTGGPAGVVKVFTRQPSNVRISVLEGKEGSDGEGGEGGEGGKNAPDQMWYISFSTIVGRKTALKRTRPGGRAKSGKKGRSGANDSGRKAFGALTMEAEMPYRALKLYQDAVTQRFRNIRMEDVVGQRFLSHIDEGHIVPRTATRAPIELLFVGERLVDLAQRVKTKVFARESLPNLEWLVASVQRHLNSLRPCLPPKSVDLQWYQSILANVKRSLQFGGASVLVTDSAKFIDALLETARNHLNSILGERCHELVHREHETFISSLQERAESKQMFVYSNVQQTLRRLQDDLERQSARIATHNKETNASLTEMEASIKTKQVIKVVLEVIGAVGAASGNAVASAVAKAGPFVAGQLGLEDLKNKVKTIKTELAPFKHIKIMLDLFTEFLNGSNINNYDGMAKKLMNLKLEVSRWDIPFAVLQSVSTYISVLDTALSDQAQVLRDLDLVSTHVLAANLSAALASESCKEKHHSKQIALYSEAVLMSNYLDALSGYRQWAFPFELQTFKVPELAVGNTNEIISASAFVDDFAAMKLDLGMRSSTFSKLWMTSSGLSNLPPQESALFLWRGDRHTDTIYQLLRGEIVLIDTIGAALQNISIHAVKVGETQLRLSSRNSSLQEKLDKALRGAQFNLTHSGQHFYHCGHTIRHVVTPPVPLMYTTAVDNQSEPTYSSLVYRTLMESRPLLSPFTTWLASISNRKRQESMAALAELADSAVLIDMQIHARVSFLNECHPGSQAEDPLDISARSPDPPPEFLL